MFKDKKTSSPDLTKEQNKIAQGTTIRGDIQSKGSFRIEGKLEGSITTDGKIVIGESGIVEGNIVCDNADFGGAFVGELKAKSRLSLRPTAKVEGKVVVDQLSIEPGAVFNATCKMKGAVKSISNNAEQSKQKEESA